MTKTESIKRPLKIFIGSAVVTLAILGLVYFRTAFVVAAVGAIGGILLQPLIWWLHERLHLPRAVSVVITALLVVGGIGGLLYGGYLLVAEQVRKLVEQAPQIRDQLVNKADQWSRRFPWVDFGGGSIDLSEQFQNLASGVFKTLRLGAEGLSYVAITLILALFVAANFRSYARGFLTLFPPERRPRVSRLGQGSIKVVRSWFLGQLIVVSTSAILTGLALLGIGMDYWLLIAALVFLLDFIPLLGAVITGVVAGLLTLGTEPSKVGWVLLIFIAIQQIESDLLVPIVMKGSVRLPEAHLLVFILVMASALGVVGIFLSPPLFAVMHYLYRESYVLWVENKPKQE
jgi:predicted PurR-regulated permease PerM